MLTVVLHSKFSITESCVLKEIPFLAEFWEEILKPPASFIKLEDVLLSRFFIVLKTINGPLIAPSDCLNRFW